MLTIREGDLLKSDCTVIIHQCNTLPTMGAGIAKQIKRKYPQAWEADKRFPLVRGERLGHFSYAISESDQRLIVNCYGQLNPWTTNGQPATDYQALRSSIAEFLETIQGYETLEPYGLTSPIYIGLPYLIGCGLARGNWNIVETLLKELSEHYQRDLVLYQLTKYPYSQFQRLGILGR